MRKPFNLKHLQWPLLLLLLSLFDLYSMVSTNKFTEVLCYGSRKTNHFKFTFSSSSSSSSSRNEIWHFICYSTRVCFFALVCPHYKWTLSKESSNNCLFLIYWIYYLNTWSNKVLKELLTIIYVWMKYYEYDVQNYLNINGDEWWLVMEF